MSTFQELKNKYPTKKISLYGDCIIIPRNEFGDGDPAKQRALELDLKKEGYMTHFADTGDGHMNFVVQLKKAEIYTKEPFPDPPKPKKQEDIKLKERLKQNRSKPDWSQEEKERVLKRMKELGDKPLIEKARQLQVEFPGRSAQAIYLVYYELTGGKATHSHSKKQIGTKKPPAETEFQPQVQSSETKSTLSYNDAIELRFSGLFEQIQKLNERITDLEQDKRNEILTRLDDLEESMGKVMLEFEQHEHSSHNGKCLVPPDLLH